MKIILCIPTLNRYDLLIKLLESAENGEVKPDLYSIIDNGGNLKLDFPRTNIYKPGVNIGLAKSWNLFINNTPSINIISNDDIEVYPDTIKRLVNSYSQDAINSPKSMGNLNVFSFFLLGKNVIRDVGVFDESLSPNYAYFEDNDYFRRCTLKGYGVNFIDECNVIHKPSSTLKKFDYQATEDHHKKFKLAKENYIKKWGGPPGKEKYQTPYNR